MQLTYILALLFSVIVAMFAIINAQPVTVDFMFEEFEISLALIILISAFAGAAILGFLGIFRQIKSGFQLRDAKGKARKLESRMEELETKLAQTEESVKEKEESLEGKGKLIEELEHRLVEKDKEIVELRKKLGIAAEEEEREEDSPEAD